MKPAGAPDKNRSLDVILAAPLRRLKPKAQLSFGLTADSYHVLPGQDQFHADLYNATGDLIHRNFSVFHLALEPEPALQHPLYLLKQDLWRHDGKSDLGRSFHAVELGDSTYDLYDEAGQLLHEKVPRGALISPEKLNEAQPMVLKERPDEVVRAIFYPERRHYEVYDSMNRLIKDRVLLEEFARPVEEVQKWDLKRSVKQVTSFRKVGNVTFPIGTSFHVQTSQRYRGRMEVYTEQGVWVSDAVDEDVFPDPPLSPGEEAAPAKGTWKF